MPRKAEFIFPPKRCEWPILSSLTIREAFFEVPEYYYNTSDSFDKEVAARALQF